MYNGDESQNHGHEHDNRIAQPQHGDNHDHGNDGQQPESGRIGARVFLFAVYDSTVLKAKHYARLGVVDAPSAACTQRSALRRCLAGFCQ